MERRAFIGAVTGGLLASPLAAEARGGYKPEFKMSVVVSADTAWGRAAIRFADVLRSRTAGRIHVTPYFNGRLFADQQTSEFRLLQEGGADFAVGSTINWSPQVKELNLFAMPFMFPHYGALDAVQTGEPGSRLLKLVEQKGVVAIAWGENGFRELNNSKRSVRRPEDLQGLKVRVVGVPICIEVFRALGATPVSMNWGEALTAFHQGTVDGHENPLALIIPYRLWEVQKHVTLWHYAIDPLILAVSGKTWMSLSAADRDIIRKAGEEIMAVQKREAREGLDRDLTLPTTLQRLYGMKVVQLSPAELQAFRQKTRPVYNKWASEMGVELVRQAERIVGDSGR